MPLTSMSKLLKVTSVKVPPALPVSSVFHWLRVVVCLAPTGTLWNMKGSLPVARQAQTLNAVVATLSCCLDMDAGTLIPGLRQAEEDRLRKTTAASDSEEQAAEELHEEVMEDEEEAPQHKKNGKAARTDDFSDLSPVSGLTRQIK